MQYSFTKNSIFSQKIVSTLLQRIMQQHILTLFSVCYTIAHIILIPCTTTSFVYFLQYN